MKMVNFEKASQEKQRAIINAGFLCFGQNGYQKTSAADVAKAAGISKASLFHYFGSKKEMYLFLCSTAQRAIEQKHYVGNTDYFECAAHLIDVLSEISELYPNILDFIITQTERRDYLKADELMDVDLNKLLFDFDTMFEHVDWTLFQDRINREMIKDLVRWIVIGNISKLKDRQTHREIFDRIRQYLSIIQPALYRSVN